MEQLALKAEKREHTGSKAAAAIRKQGRIPAIVYGHQQQPCPVSLSLHDFNVNLHHGHRLMDIELDGKTEKLLVKDLQYDHLGKDIIHADLIRVDLTEKVRLEVPIEVKGKAKGAEEGGIIEEHADRVEVECTVTSIPENIPVSVRELEVGDSIHARDLDLPAGVKLISDPELLLVTCRMVTAAPTEEEIEEEAPTAPEVIGEEEKAEQAETEGPQQQ